MLKFTRPIMSFLVLLIFLAGMPALAGRIHFDRVLFGIEYTFQDQEMVNEPGRSTISTPYKEQKASDIAYRLAENLGLSRDTVFSKTTWKPGHYILVPGDGKWVVNSEPVTIEINTTPRHLNEIEATAAPIFAATRANGLVPYVNPAAERSGMGHIHVGGKVIGDNPFFANPQLLRNVMVYLHKHPSLLYGFGEAYDIGINSNIESYHIAERQKEFQAAVAAFDAWYDHAGEHERASQGFNTFLKVLQEHDKTSNFFEHYRFMNLEHVKQANFTASDAGKFTIEFRNFRPPNDPGTAKAFAEMLGAVMEKQSDPAHREAFEWISAEQYNRFNTGTKVESDWALIRKELDLNNSYLDRALTEYVMSVQSDKYTLKDLPGSELFRSYSQKENKGTFFELRLPVSSYESLPNLEMAGHRLEFEKVTIRKGQYWVASIDTKTLEVSPVQILNGRVGVTSSSSGSCKVLFH
jgi:hypothetical protein